jgi:transposase
MEACFGGQLEALDHDARLSRTVVKPFLKGHKNDYRDAEAIAEAIGDGAGFKAKANMSLSCG